MTKYTTTSLINELQKYPSDTPIETELAFIYRFNDLCYIFKNEYTEEEFLDYCKRNASKIAIFEGSWDKNNISDLNNIMPNYIDDWHKTKITIDKSEYDELMEIKDFYDTVSRWFNG